MHLLSPPTLVARAREPLPPIRHRVLELPTGVLLAVATRLFTITNALKHEGGALPRLQREARPDTLLRTLEREWRIKRDCQRRRLEDRAPLVQVCPVPLPTVVEAQLDLDAEGHLAAHAQQATYQTVGPVARRSDRHEVLNLSHAMGAQEAGDQDLGIREVELFGRPVRAGRSESPVAAALPVEECPEQARGVETRAAVPVNRPLGAYECDSMEVADEAVFGYRQGAAPLGRFWHRRGSSVE